MQARTCIGEPCDAARTRAERRGEPFQEAEVVERGLCDGCNEERLEHARAFEEEGSWTYPEDLR